MTSLGTFEEGLALVALAIACAVLGAQLKIPWLATIAPVLLTAGLAYVGGGAAGKMQTLRAFRKRYSLSDNSVRKLKEMI